jgi:hypothetical protein
MSLILSGSDGVSDIDGSAATPAIRGTDANTGIFFPAADTIAFSEGGVESMRIDSDGDVGIGTTSPAYRLDVVNSSGTSYAQVKGANSGTTITTPGNGGATVFLMNTNSTANTFNAIYGVDAGENVTSGVAFINNSDANNEGTMAFMTRPSGGSITEQMRITSGGLLQFNSGYGSVATAFGCRAWVNFNGTGTVSIRASGNVSSITDNGTGDYTVNFTTALTDANYSASAGCGNENADDRIVSPLFFNQAPTTSGFRLRTTNNSGSPQDVSRITVSVFR